MAIVNLESTSGEGKLALQVKTLLWQKGSQALQQAREVVQNEKLVSSQLQLAVEYFMSGWKDVVHPALFAIAAEAVGGDPMSTTEVSVAYILLAGGADIHDDIIDDSSFKYEKETVLGKFGKDITVLAGDALLFKGFFALQKACAALPERKRDEVLKLTLQAFNGISNAETIESQLKAQKSMEADDYLNMINVKAAVAEATMKIGAIIGGGSPAQVEALGSFGKIFGALLTIRDEFIDLYELDEMKNRLEKEWLPLPLLYALKNVNTANLVQSLLRGGPLTENTVESILDVVVDSKEAQALKKRMEVMVADGIKQLDVVAESNKRQFELMLSSTLEDI
jgi:geranylgeranyl pyrophosphate synthase